ncbi:hypothetical protein HRbin19_01547 [bacterium HR19]|nr:hypothetical protein HRbin19_01547 [bacterium HR19]
MAKLIRGKRGASAGSSKVRAKTSPAQVERTRKKEKKIKFRKIDLPNQSAIYKVHFSIDKDAVREILKEVSIPQFISSLLSLGKIPIGSIKLSTYSSGELYEVEVEFEPSYILKLITKHSRFSYFSSVVFDQSSGYITRQTKYLEAKTDGREFKREDDFSEDEQFKDPVALFLDFLSADKKDLFGDDEDFSEKMFHINYVSEDKLKVLPSEDIKESFSFAELELKNLYGFKIPQRVFVKGLLSIFDLFVDLV